MTTITELNFDIADMYDSSERLEALAKDCQRIDHRKSGTVHVQLGIGEADDPLILVNRPIFTPTSGEDLERKVVSLMIDGQFFTGRDAEWVIVKRVY